MKPARHSLKTLPDDGADRDIILLVNGSDAERKALQALLSHAAVEVQSLQDTSQALSWLAGKEASLILVLLEPDPPDVRGLLLLSALRGDRRHAAVPVLVWAQGITPRFQAECLTLGAESVLDKAAPLEMVARMLLARLDRARESRASLRVNPVTGLPNEQAFREMFARTHALSVRLAHPLSMALIGLDAPDGQGKREDDVQLLQQVGALLAATFRSSDFLGHWQGNTFAGLFPNARPDGAAKALEKVRRTVNRERFDLAPGRSVRVTLSCGIAEVPARADSPDAPLREAARLLDLARAAGGDRLQFEVRTSSRRILLADSDPICTRLLAHRLEQAGFEVLTAADHTAATRAVREGAPDLVVLDIDLKHVDGAFDLFQEISKAPGGAPPVILLGPEHSESVAQSLASGASDYITKPFSPGEVIARIRRHLKRLRA